MSDSPEGAFPEAPIYEQLARIGKAMASPVRLRLLDTLDGAELSVEDLAALSGVGLKNTSAQLQQLRAANLVAVRRVGVSAYYRLADPGVSRFLEQFERFAESRLSELRERIAEILDGGDDVRPVTAEELEELMRDPAVVVVDVRSAQDFERGHLAGAVSLPQSELAERLDELPADRLVVAYCGGPYCVASPHAAAYLRGRGLAARSLAGGVARWRRAGRELVVTEQ